MKSGQIVVALVLAALIAAAIVYLPVVDALLALSDWANEHPGASWPAFMAVFALAVVLMSPAWPFMLGAGYLFGPVTGMLLASGANLVGMVAAFLIGRYLGGASIAARAHELPRFAALSRAITRNGLMVVALSRAAVIIPHNLLNYAYAFTAVKFSDYVFGSWLGTLPVIALPVLIGSKATDLATVLSGEDPLEFGGLLSFGIAALALMGVLLLLGRYATRSFDRELGERSSRTPRE